MCRPNLVNKEDDAILAASRPPTRTKTTTTTASSSPTILIINSLLQAIWPVPPLALAALLPFLPSSLFLNRGYTIWFHWLGMAYFLTRSPFLRKFLIVQGSGISLGWYAALVHDLVVHDRFCHALYKNMPSSMTAVMLDDQGDFVKSNLSLLYMGLSHVLDTIGHPLVTYLFWYLHCRHSKNSSNIKNNTRTISNNVSSVLTWPVLVATFLTSRLWSLTHTYHNQGSAALYYYGHDVYVIDTLDSWFPAYATEGAMYVCMVLWKLCFEQTKETGMTKEVGAAVMDESKPILIASISGVSSVSSDSR